MPTRSVHPVSCTWGVNSCTCTLCQGRLSASKRVLWLLQNASARNSLKCNTCQALPSSRPALPANLPGWSAPSFLSWPQPSLQMPFSWNCFSKAVDFIPLVQASTHPSALAKEVQPAHQMKELGDLLTMYHTREGKLVARPQCCIWNLLNYSVNEV